MTSSFFLWWTNLRAKRNFIGNAIQDIPGLSAVKPKAGLYIFLKSNCTGNGIDDDGTLVLNFLKQESAFVLIVV